MSKNQIMYEYSKSEYENAVSRKNDIRNRAATFFSIGFTIMSAAATISFTISDGEFSNWKITLLTLSVISLVATTVLFLIIYSPSNQLIHLPKNLLDDLRDIENAQENKELIDYYRGRGEFKYIVNELAFAYISDRLAENFLLYDKKNKLFMNLFVWMSITMMLSIILVIISIGI